MKIYCAVDTSDFHEASTLINQVKDRAGIKLGLEFLTSLGLGQIDHFIHKDCSIFLDAKLHDIPNTVYKAAKNLGGMGIKYLTIHCLGGSEMVAAAVEGIRDGAKSAGITEGKIVGVTVLTSLDQTYLNKFGLDSKELTIRLAEEAIKGGARALVCSGLEVSILRRRYSDIELIVPGIRLEEQSPDDQKRTITPRHAIELGADILVIGRAITGATNPSETLDEILKLIGEK